MRVGASQGETAQAAIALHGSVMSASVRIIQGKNGKEWQRMKKSGAVGP